MSENKLKVSDYKLSPWPKELHEIVQCGGQRGTILVPINPQPKQVGQYVWEFGE